MSTMKEHLKEMHTAHADFHATAAKAHQAMAADENESDASRDFHKTMAAAHTTAGESAVQCCKSLDATHKAMGMGEPDRIGPDAVSIIYREDNVNLKMVPRAGAPEFRKATEGMDAELVKLAGLEEL